MIQVCTHSYRSETAGVVEMSSLIGLRSFLTRRGSNGVKAPRYQVRNQEKSEYESLTARSVMEKGQLTNLMSLMSIQLFEDLVSRSNN